MDEYDQALHDWFDVTPEQQAKANLFAGQQKPADPTSVESARQLGYDLPTIDLDPKGFAAEAKFRKNSNIVDQSPAVASYIAESPVNAQVSHDDLGVLSDFAQPWLTQGAALMNYYIKGATWNLDWQKAMSQGFAQTDLNRKVAFDVALSKSDRAGWEAQRDVEGLSPLASMVGSFFGSTLSSMKTALPAAATGAAIGGPAGAAVGFAGGIAADMAMTSFGSSYREFDAIRDDNGKPLPESVKIIGALQAGTVAGILGGVGGKITADIGGNIANKIIGKILTDPVTNHLVARAAGEVFRSGLTFGSISAGIELGTIAAGEVGKYASGGDFQTIFNNQEEVAKAAKRVAQAFAAGGTLGGILGTVPAGMNFLLDKARIGQTQLDLAMLRRMSEKADESSTAKIAPEIFADYVQKHVGVTPLRVQAEAIASLRPGFLAEPGYQQTVERALPHGGDVEVRAGDFFTKADAKEREALIPYVRGQGGVTGAEAELLAKRPPESYAEALQQFTQPTLKPTSVEAMPSAVGSEGRLGTEALQEFVSGNKRSAELIANEVIDKAKAYENNMWLGPMLNAGMTPGKDAVKYSKLLQERQRSITEYAMKAAEREIGRTETKLWQENLKDEMATAEKTVEERPDVQAHRRIVEGIDGVKVVKLDRAEVEDALASLGQPHSIDVLSRYIGNAENVPMDAVASISGFRTGRDMIEALVDMRREQEASGQGFATWRRGKVKEIANTAMEDKYGSLQDNIMKAAVDAAISVEQLDVLTEDFKQRFNGTITRNDVLNYAKETLPNLPVAEARNVKGFMDAVARKGQEAESFLLAKKPEDAFKAKQQQLYNFGLLQAARKFNRLHTQGMRTIERFSDQLTPAGIDQEYTDHIHAMLQRHAIDIPRSVQNIADATKGESLADFAQRLAGNEVDIVLNPTTNGAINIALEKMDAGQFLEFKETLDSMVYHGKLADKIERLNSIADLQAEKNALALQFAGLTPQMLADRTDIASRVLKSADAMAIKTEQIGDWVDGDNINGVFNRNVTIPMKNAQHFENDLKASVGADIAKLGTPKGARAKIDNTVFRNTETGKYIPMNKNSLLMVMLNLGNEGNKKVLLQGYGVSEAQVRGLVNKYATKEDWEFVQGLGDAIGKLWPHIEKATKEATGVAPDRVVPTKIKTDFGTFDGWYFPLIRDNTQDKVITTRGPADLRPLPLYVSANSFKDRTGATYPVDLSLDLLPSRIVETIHAIAFKTPVREAQKLIGSDEMRRGINEKFGPEYYDAMGTWLKDVANNGRRLYANKLDANVQGFLAEARGRMITFLVGWRPSTAAIHSGSAASNSFGEVMFGPGEGSFADRAVELSRAVRDLTNLSTAPDLWDMLNRKSGELRYRMQNVERDIGDVLDRSFGKSLAFRQMQHHSLALVGYSDKLSAGFVWLSKYRLAMKAGIDEETAVQIADKAVRKAHGSQSIMDQADIQRGPEYKKMFTMFYGYFNHNYNRERDVIRGLGTAWKGGDGLKMLAEVARLQTYITIPALIHEWIRGERKEDESLGAFMARSTALQVTNGYPGIRDFGHIMLHGGEPSATPLLEYYHVLQRSWHDIGTWNSGDNTDPKFVRDSLEAIGMVQPGIATKYTAGLAQALYDHASGSERMDDPDFWRLIMEGNPTPKTKH